MTSAAVEERDWTNLKTGLVADAPTGKTWAQRGDFVEIPWQTLSSPLHWGKNFASGERVSRRSGLPHSDRIDEDTKAVRWLRPGDAFRLAGVRA